MRRNKKGQEEGQAAAVLILVIGLFIVLYILLLPPEQRRDILDLDNTTNENGIISKTILSESPGLIKPYVEETTKHEVTAINLFVKSEPQIDLLADSLSIRKSWFNSYSPKIKFDISDRDKLNKANLYFRVFDSKGTLRVWINGNEFYSEEIKENNLKIIDVPLSILGDENEIKFRVDTPLVFWNPNTYNLGEVSLKKEYNLVNEKETRLFSIPQEERDRITSAQLSFFMYCNELQGDNTNLNILLNKREAFNGIIRCIGNRETIEVDKSLLRTGTNELSFELGEGDFLFSDIFVKTDYKGINYPIYYFTLSEDDFTHIQNGEANVVLKLKLSGTAEEKGARIVINDGSLTMKSSSNSFERNVNELVENGDNFIKIVPSNTFSIDSLKIVLE